MDCYSAQIPPEPTKEFGTGERGGMLMVTVDGKIPPIPAKSIPIRGE